MWRKRAPIWATLAAGIAIVGLCVVWAVLAQIIVTPGCELNKSLPPNAGNMECSGGNPLPLIKPGR